MAKFKFGKLKVNIIFDTDDPSIQPLKLVHKRMGEWITPVPDLYKRMFNTCQSKLVIEFIPCDR